MRNKFDISWLCNEFTAMTVVAVFGISLPTVLTFAEGSGTKIDPFTGSDVKTVIDGGSVATPAYYRISGVRDLGQTPLEIGTSNPNNNLAIADATISGTSCRIGYSRLGGGNSVALSGKGDAVCFSGAFKIGCFGSNNVVTIADGACASLGEIAVGVENTGYDNILTVTGSGAVVSVASNLRIGVAGSGNSATIANGADFSCGTASVGDAYTSVGNGFSISGAGTNVSISSAGAPRDEVASFYAGRHGSRNIVKVDSGAALGVSKGICVGLGSDGCTEYGCNNALIASGFGTTVSTDNLFVGYNGSANLLVVQNGALVKISNELVVDFNLCAKSNFIYLASGSLAVKGDRVIELDHLISAGLVKVWRVTDDGSVAWVTATKADIAPKYFADENEAKAATSAGASVFAGYNGLAGYTVVTGGSPVRETDVRWGNTRNEGGALRPVCDHDNWYWASWYWYYGPFPYPYPYPWGCYYDWAWPYDYGVGWSWRGEIGVGIRIDGGDRWRGGPSYNPGPGGNRFGGDDRGGPQNNNSGQGGGPGGGRGQGRR